MTATKKTATAVSVIARRSKTATAAPSLGADCVLDPVRGNGTRERGEGCDDGEDTPDDGDGRDAARQLEEGFFCPPGQACVEIIWWRRSRTPDEACDDNDNDDGDGCAAGLHGRGRLVLRLERLQGRLR